MTNTSREVPDDWRTKMQETGVRLRYWWPKELAAYNDEMLGRLWEGFYFSEAPDTEKVPTAPDARFLMWLKRQPECGPRIVGAIKL